MPDNFASLGRDCFSHFIVNNALEGLLQKSLVSIRFKKMASYRIKSNLFN